MNEKELQNIWNKFTSKFNVSKLGLDYEKFKLKMDTADKRKKFFDKYSQSLDLGDYGNYEKRITQTTPDSTEPSKSQDGNNWLQNVIGSLTQSKDKKGSESTKPTTQQPVPPQEKKVAPAYSSTFKSRPCDENTYPWTRGCKNNKIGQMNQIYFGDRYGDIYGDDLYYQLRSLGYFGAPNQKDGEITQFIYDGVLKDSLQESEISNRKKVVKETVKNVLKQRLNKK